MKKVFLSLALVLLSFACGPVPEEVEATSSLGSPDPMSRACATNFIRANPNYCRSVPSGTFTPTLTIDGTCQSVTTGSIGSVSNATAVDLDVIFNILTANAIANRVANITFFADAACTQQVGVPFSGAAREQVAAVATQLAFWHSFAPAVPVVSGNIYYSGTFSSCTGCTIKLGLRAYYD